MRESVRDVLCERHVVAGEVGVAGDEHAVGDLINKAVKMFRKYAIHYNEILTCLKFAEALPFSRRSG